MRHNLKTSHLLAMAALAATPVLRSASTAAAATDTFTGAAGTSSGTLVFPYPAATSTSTAGTAVQYYSLDTTSANFTSTGGGTTYAPGDNVVFSTTAGGFLSPQSSFANTSAPALLQFSGGSSSTVWTFLRSSNVSGSTSGSSGFNAASGSVLYPSGGPVYPTGLPGADSFNSISPFATSAVTTGNVNTNVLLDSTFLGTVVLRSRSGGTPTGTTEIDGGTLQINDSQALPGKATPTLILGGGTYSININTGRYNTGDGNSNPGSGDFRSNVSFMNVTANSTLANAQVDDNGNSRFLSNAFGAAINITAGATLTFATGSQYTAIFPEATSGTTNLSANGITTVGSGFGTISVGSSTGVLRIGVAGSGSASNFPAQPVGNTTTDFSTGTASGAILANDTYSGAATDTFNMGGLNGGANTFLLGSSSNGQNAAGLDIYSVGTLNLAETFAGKITNGEGTSTRIVSLAKIGSGTQTVADNYFSGPITVADATGANTGTLRATSVRSLTDSNAAVTINSGATIDLNGNSPNAGKAFTLAGGSLVNNGTAAVTLRTGTSAGLTAGTAAGGTYTALASANSSAPSVTLTGGGGSGATAVALLHLDSVAAPSQSTGYLVAPLVTVSPPTGDVAGGRTAQLEPILNNKTGILSLFTLTDPGFGYESTPTVTISGGVLTTGAAGPTTTVAANLTMTVDSILLTSAGTGYTSAPTVAFAAAGNTAQTTAAVATAGFASVALTANSNVGGSGPLTINPVVSGAFTLTKIGTGTTTLGGANNYSGGTVVSAGTLATDTAGVLGTGNVTVSAGTLSLGNALSIADTAAFNVSEAATVGLNAGGGTTEVVAALTNLTSGASVPAGTYTAATLDSTYFDNVAVFSGDELLQIGTATAPEPTSILLAGLAAAPLALGRRRRRSA